MRIPILCAFGVALLGLVRLTHATVADIIPVGGFVTDSDTHAPLDGSYDISFSLYGEERAAEPIWRKDFPAVEIDDGFFSVYLDVKDTPEVITVETLWLGITIESDEEMARIRIGAVPFALESQVCHEVLGVRCDNGEFLKGWENGRAVCEPVDFDQVQNQPTEQPRPLYPGEGLVMGEDGDTLAVDKSTIDSWCLDEARLRLVLDGSYVEQDSPRVISREMLPETLDAATLQGYSPQDFAPVSHGHDGRYQPPLKTTLRVSPVGDARANGDALLAAMDAAGNASKENPMLIKIEPGVYLLETEEGEAKSLEMKQWVDVEGAGRNMTVIRSRGNTERLSGTVKLSDNSALRHVSVENLGGVEEGYAIALFAESTTGTRAENVALSTGNSNNCRTVYVRFGSVSVENATVESKCFDYSYGFFVSDAEEVVVKNVDVLADSEREDAIKACAMLLDSMLVTIQDSTIRSRADGVGESIGVRPINSEGALPSSIRIVNSVVAASGGSTATACQASISNDTGGQKLFVQGSTLTAESVAGVATIIETEWDSPAGNGSTTGTTTIELFNSTLDSGGATAIVNAPAEVRFVSSLIKGGGMQGLTTSVACAATTDEHYAFYANGCPVDD